VASREAEIAWSAGLFEGEGTFTWGSGRAEMRVKMTDLDVLERLLDIWSVGKIYGPYQTPSTDGSVRKPHWVWICPPSFVPGVFAAMTPWLGARRLAQARRFHVLP
jgi:hypothetical protein